MANEDLQALSDDIRTKLGISDEVAKKLSQKTALNGSQDIAFTIPIKGGAGQGGSSTKTWWKTLSGYGVVIAPSGGSWHLIAKQNGNVFIDRQNVQAGQQVTFTTGTGFNTSFEIDATWSEKADTTLQVKLHVTY